MHYKTAKLVISYDMKTYILFIDCLLKLDFHSKVFHFPYHLYKIKSVKLHFTTFLRLLIILAKDMKIREISSESSMA